MFLFILCCNSATVGDKGAKHMYDCNGPYDDADNILRFVHSNDTHTVRFINAYFCINSVTFDPTELIAYTAWETGNKETWIPAACSTYVALDLKEWFSTRTN